MNPAPEHTVDFDLSLAAFHGIFNTVQQRAASAQKMLTGRQGMHSWHDAPHTVPPLFLFLLAAFPQMAGSLGAGSVRQRAWEMRLKVGFNFLRT
jgi:hypothetical protein